MNKDIFFKAQAIQLQIERNESLLNQINAQNKIGFFFNGGTGIAITIKSNEKHELITGELNETMNKTLEFTKMVIISNIQKETDDLKKQFDELHG